MEHQFQFFSHPQKRRVRRIWEWLGIIWGLGGCVCWEGGQKWGALRCSTAQGVVRRRICASLTFITTLSIIHWVACGIFIRAPLNPATFTPPFLFNLCRYLSLLGRICITHPQIQVWILFEFKLKSNRENIHILISPYINSNGLRVTQLKRLCMKSTETREICDQVCTFFVQF